ncbi:MAG: hypothetical protein QM628_17575 [Propionicimonas sp.]
MAFDHAQILRERSRASPRELEYTTMATAFCEATFTLPDLRRVYQAV